MGKLLIKIFVKNSEDVKDPKVRENYGKFAGMVGIISNLLLCGMKISVGLVINSIAVIADGINNLSDASSSVITLIGFKLASQPEDKTHPYGHARIEYLTGLFISILIIIVGLFLLRSSVDKILHPLSLDFDYVSIIVLTAAILIKLWQTFFNMYVGKKISSLALIATGTDSRNDVIATSAVLAGIIITKATGLQLDGYMGSLVAFFIIWSGIKLIKETSSPLLGEAPDPEIVRHIADTAKSGKGVLGIHDLVVHNYGPGKIFASLHVEVNADTDIMANHDMIDNIERKISSDLNIHCVVHMDPVRTDDPVVKKVRPEILGIIKDLQGVRDIHDLRVVSGPTHTNIIFDVVLGSECVIDEKEIGDIIEKRLKQIDPGYFSVITFDRAYTDL